MNNLSIKRKILYAFISLSLVCFIIFSLIFTSVYIDHMLEETSHNISDNSMIISNQLEDMLSGVRDASNMATFAINSVVEDYAKLESYNQSVFALEVIDQLYDISITFSDVESIAFIDSEGRVYATEIGLYTNKHLFETSAIKYAIDKTTGQSIWFPIDTRCYLAMDDKPVLTLGKKIQHINTGKHLGYLVMNVSGDTLSRYLVSEHTSYEIAQGDHIVASHNPTRVMQKVDWSTVPKANYRIHKQGILDSTITVRLDIESMGWILLGQASLLEIQWNIYKTVLFIVLIALGIVAVEIYLGSLISNHIVNPINAMGDTMKQLGKGNFDMHFEVKSKDEIGLFADRFNRMSDKIKSLLTEVEQKERAKREYERALVLEQVKPHFLYNTLDTISALSEMDRKKEVLRAINAMACYYRNSLSSGREIIQVAEEINGLESYLYLQRLQYFDVFDYRMDIAPEVMEARIVKITLQPLVENAIYHGIKEKSGHGMLDITVKRVGDDRLMLQVRDDGVGMTQDVADKIMDGNAIPGDHFGMRNVRDRLHFYYGDDVTFKVKSEQGVGTTVTIMLPLCFEVEA